MTRQEVYLLETLSVEAKGIYGALYSFAGAESTIYPSADYLCKILHMSKKRFQKHMDLLIRAGIVKEIKRMKDEFERLPVNVYTLAGHIQFDSGQSEYAQKVNTNSKALNNGKENINYQKIVDCYNDICVSIVDRIFAEDIYNNVINAVRTAIFNDTKEFLPVQDQIKDQIKELIGRSFDDTKITSGYGGVR